VVERFNLEVFALAIFPAMGQTSGTITKSTLYLNLSPDLPARLTPGPVALAKSCDVQRQASLGHSWKAQVGIFWRAPKHQGTARKGVGPLSIGLASATAAGQPLSFHRPTEQARTGARPQREVPFCL
jgi:hypothetical protein